MAARPPPAAGLARLQRGNTHLAVQRLATSGRLQPAMLPDAPYGRYFGRRIIGSGTRIDGGVYLGRLAREAIVVDMARPGSLLRRLYAALVEALCTGAGGRVALPSAGVVAHLRAMVGAAMPYDEATVDALAAGGQLGDGDDDGLVDLDVFLRAGGGVCRHQACLVGACLERLADEGRLHGRAGLERRHASGWFSHAWVQWVAGDGELWVLDPAQDRYSPLRRLPAAAARCYAPLPNRPSA
jgi:hypothetical protein